MQFTFYRGDKYLHFDELEHYCQKLAEHFPEWVSYKQVGRSRHGKAIFCLLIGAQDHSISKRPAIWIDGGTHAIEWVGVVSAVHTASRWIENLALGDTHTQEWFKKNTAIVLPCIGPDGFDATMRGAPYLRSTMRTPKTNEVREGLDMHDIDGDGVVRYMRVKTPLGNMVEDEESSQMMRTRTLDDDADRAYLVLREGEFINWDGVKWKSAAHEFGIDLNRNFTARWAPFSMFGMDAGDFALSEPESRAVTDAFASFPCICAAITNHSYTGCLITQPYCANSPLPLKDIRMLKTLSEHLAKNTGYKTFEAHREFAYDQKQDMVGVWADTMTTIFGVPAYTLEIWDPYAYAGIDNLKPAEQFIFPDPKLLGPLFKHLAAKHPELLQPWKPFEHPQLGRIEIGGMEYTRCIHNPPEPLLSAECDKAFVIADRLRRALPKVHASAKLKRVAENTHEVTFVLANSGYFSTSGTTLGRGLRATPAVSATIRCSGATKLLSERATIMLEHLEGWGSMGHAGLAAHAALPELPAQGQRTFARWLVAGSGTLEIKWHAGRGGEGVLSVPVEADDLDGARALGVTRSASNGQSQVT